ncbi:ATP-binding protein [Phenylobacterium sp.]|uniref:hybrid sensor histidine kinase/response regulator n=1 Tax=Phenylobacterium sp. TaxID=1871053 RepID=UPI00271B9A02|nr:ATP-binding protein [Phenylobacterium sp.]MDO8802692.1 ATP-binding protein [Phenylobacterium sp.]
MRQNWLRKAGDVPFRARLDQAITGIREATPVRLVVCLCAFVIFTVLLSPVQAAVWLITVLVMEIWVLRAIARYRRGPVDRRARFGVRGAMIGVVLCWTTLALLLWRDAGLAGQACALILVMTLVAVSILRFFSTPAIFVVAGSAPALVTFLFLGFREGRDLTDLLAISLALSLSVVFSLGRAIATPSAQAQQLRINDTLRELQILTDNVTDVIARTDMAGVHTYLSPSVEKVLGYRPEELIGVSRADIVDPAYYALILEASARMQADPERSEVITCRVRHKDGRWLWIQTNAKLVYENGIPAAVIDVSRDITEQVAKDLALREAKAEAESATQAKADFLANVSHEIRTPMNGVLGALQLLEREPISPEGRELMRQAADCGLMLSQLLNDVLDFSKIEAGQIDLTPAPMDVGEALDAVMALLDGQARAKGIELYREISGADLWIAADPVRVRQAMFNLLGNAIKFTPVGHVAARLTVTTEPDGQRHVRLEIEDTGVGIPHEAQPHLFERFRQAESSTARRFGGSGLGLSITRALAQLMGGDIAFTSTQGVGSTFWLDFTAPAATPVLASPVDEGLLEGVRILLVEDNPTNRLVARTLLTRLGAQVAEAEDGLVGLNAARDGGFDLILMDVQMPNMDGIEATRAIRALPGVVAQTPIIGLTANVMTHQLGAYRAAGMNGVVAKPIAVAALIGQIAGLLGEDDTAIAV